ncbi:sigma 54-interacting transcriptional regulator [Clostridium aciditolerans]|uniref:Sigma 54-interacting transcriptional regulator n=1 Tax=Clostridium aciditolerans TaxID=339861 RepID=A0A934HRT6_9CLOT|nr:sigma 54-interacting transcriptional regulator [Clostridium aciditolerans]MBI6872133.1 sigma 54-interacting transcriptional regulator [Clostridium aciditolerans]
MDIKTIGDIISEYVNGIIILDKEEKIIWSDDLYKEISYEKEILGKKFSDVFSIDLNQIKNSTINNLSGKKYKIKCKTIKDGEEEYTLVIIGEITDFNNKDTKIYCLEKIIDSINDGIIISNYEGRIVLYNKSQEKLEELSSKEVVGKFLWEGYQSKPELSEHQKVFKTNTPIIDKYQAHSYKGGVAKYVSYSTYPIVKDGETIAVYSVCKNESSLQALLHETLELKRKLYSKSKYNEKNYQKNGTQYIFTDIIGDSSVMVNLIKESQTMALVNSPILIVGETGTGKEVFAQSIHNFSKNNKEAFVDINCSAIPENLLESILFGTVKGAYTGAVDQAGLFEEAGKGTLFLDEINSMPILMQSKLLRVLQEKKVRRVGGINSIPISCRIISAVNEDPQKAIKEDKLRQDLYYRLAGVSLYIPPLRERKEDIVTTIEFFINKYNKMLNKNIKSISKELREVMIDYKWPGNVRELEHVIENIMIRTTDTQTELKILDIPHYIREDMIGSISIDKVQKSQHGLPDILRSIEKELILESLKKNNWNISRATKDLGIIRQSLEYRMKKLKIEKPKE